MAIQVPLLRPKNPEILNGWKRIAKYLGKGIRTVQRYEQELGLPIRRPIGKLHGSVIATKVELDGWITARPLRGSFQSQATSEQDPFLNALAELRRLRLENAELRDKLGKSLELLETTALRQTES